MKTVFRLVIRTQVTRGRALALGALGVLPIVLAIVTRHSTATTPATAVFDVIDHLGISVIAPITSLVFASAAFGDLVDDRTLVYIWLRPIPRWQMMLGALAACLSTALPFVMIPLVIAVVASGVGGSLLGATVASATLAVIGYSTLFLALGLRIKRALVWGLAYVVIWEGAIARVARGAARLSIQVYARSLLAAIAHGPKPLKPSSNGAALTAIAAIAVIASVVTVRWLETADVN